MAESYANGLPYPPMQAVKLSDLLEMIRRNSRPVANEASSRPALAGESLRPVGPTRLDFLAVSAPADIPGWFRREYATATPVPVPVPVAVRYADAELARHERQYGGPAPDGDADYEARRLASLSMVNELSRIAADDHKVHEANLALAAGRCEVRLQCRWRYFWAVEMAKAGGA